MSSDERSPLPTGGHGLLRGSRTRSYGSLVQSPLSPVRQRRIEHQVQPGETLQGLSLKYGVSMEQIKRANRLYTNDSMFLKKSLCIPVLSDPDANGNEVSLAGPGQVQGSTSKDSSLNGTPAATAEKKMPDASEEGTSELSPMDFLKRMDGLISQSKQAALRRCQEGEKRLAALEAACTSRTSDHRLTRSHSATSSPRMHQQATLGAVPLTITKRTKKIRDREDDIFEL